MCYKEDIILGLVAVVNALPDKELKRELINNLCQPFATNILTDSNQIPGREVEDIGKEKKLSLSRVAKNLDKLSLIVKNLTPADDNAKDHIIVGVLTDMWQLLERFLLVFYVASYH